MRSCASFDGGAACCALHGKSGISDGAQYGAVPTSASATIRITTSDAVAGTRSGGRDGFFAALGGGNFGGVGSTRGGGGGAASLGEEGVSLIGVPPCSNRVLPA